MYINRAIEKQIIEMAKSFPVVMVCGPRQVGKTTVLKRIGEKLPDGLNYVSFDDPAVRQLAKSDPRFFLQSLKLPVFIDEFQYAPEILPYIKMAVDSERKIGQFFLSGSQLFSMMRNIGESLAGRVGIVNLFSFSQAELMGRENRAFLPSPDFAAYRRIKGRTAKEIFDDIFRGSMPQLVTDKTLSVEGFYGSYIRTYLERDIRDIITLKNEGSFLKFLRCLAARTGQEFIASELARDVEVDSKTISSWLNVLETTGIIYLLQPYYSSTMKRIVKRPKIYFMDTGLACYLSMWNNPRSLEVSAMAGPMFETYVVSELIKSYEYAGRRANYSLYYYRDTLQREIDVLIWENGMLYPVEIKKSTNPGEKAVRNFNVLDKSGLIKGHGAVICLIPELLPLNREVYMIPVDEI